MNENIVAAVLCHRIVELIGVGLVVWAHHLSSHNRNGGLWPYELAFVLWGVSVVAAVAQAQAAVEETIARAH